MSDLDARIVELFQSSEGTEMTVDPGLTDYVIFNAQRRRTERRIYLTTALAVLVMLVVSVVSHLQTREPQPTDRLQNSQSLTEWLGSLDAATDPQIAYAQSLTLHLGTQTVPLTGPGLTGRTEIQLREAVPGGFVAAVYRAPYPLAIVGHDGSVRPLGPYGARSDVIEVSPDGTQAIVGAPATAVIDLPSGDVVAVPPRNTIPVVWSADGIYLVQKGNTHHAHRLLLWRPDRQVEPMPLPGCDAESEEVVSLLAHARNCSGLMSVSPTGRYGLTTTSLVDRLDGVSRPLAGYPLGGYYDYPEPYDWHNIRWEDAQHVVIAMFLRTADGTATTVLVRCAAGTGDCERVSDTIAPHGPQNTVSFVLVP